MEIESLNSIIAFAGRKRASSFLSSAFDLPALIEMIKHSKSWTNGEPDTLVLIKNPEEKVVLAALHEGTQVTSFQANDSVTFQILEGKLRYSSHNISVVLGEGQTMTINEKIKYKLNAAEETVFLLTILNANLKVAEAS